MKNRMALLAALFVPLATAFASGTDYSPPAKSAQPEAKGNATVELYKRGKESAALGNYAEAELYFSQALRSAPKSPDILNMLAYSQRKQGKLDRALGNYQKALAARPHFPEAREYLGEAYIQAVLREIETLKSYGADGEEQLRELTAALKKAADDLK